MEQKITKETSIIFNQLWIVKAIEDGNSSFLISKKIPGVSIGEIIEARYESLDAEPKTPKINKNNSILYEREWIAIAEEEGIPISRRKISNYSLAEIISLKYFEKEILKKSKEQEKNKVFQIKMGSD